MRAIYKGCGAARTTSLTAFDLRYVKMKRKILALTCAIVMCDLTSWAKAKSLDLGGSMVVIAEGFEHRQKRSIQSSMTAMHIKSTVKSRFALVKTTTTMENSAAKAKEMTFSVRLPTHALISDFSMIVGGVTFVGKVKEKERARAEYQGARERGNSAGLVTAKVRETQVFNVAANVPAHESVTFSLEYQELLQRKFGKYEQVVFINPGQRVDDLSVNIYVTEDTGITTFEAHHPQQLGGKHTVNGGYDVSGEVGVNVEIKRSKHQALASFKPTQAQQRQMLTIPEDERKVSVTYDVTRQELGGEILMRDGYFVHFFAPENLPVLPKDVVLVIDQSGSMLGDKIRQTKEAFATVLNDMSDADKFNIVAFSNRASVWENSGMVPVTRESVDLAINYVNDIRAGGATNLNDALLRAVDLLGTSERTSESLSAIIVLTDGDPTVGETNEDRIRQNVKRRINGAISLFCIGFGEGLNHNFLKKLANDNDGIARKIYSASDAAIQLRGFFQEVATPLLLNINFRYTGEEISVCGTKIDKYFKGSEVVVVGTMREHALLEARITGVNDGGEVDYSATGHEITDFSHSEEETGDFSNYIERLWAYFTIRDLLEEKVLAETQEERESLIAKVTNLALKYGFVTPFTSMAVVLPEDEITTTAAAATVTPIPVCLRRGVDIEDESNPSRIWCPYIFEGRRQEAHGERDRAPPISAMRHSALMPRMNSLGRSRPLKLMRMSSRRRYHGSARSRAFNPAIAARRQSFPGRQSAYFPSMSFVRQSFAYDEDYHYRPTRPPAPAVSTHCGEVLRDSVGQISLPSSLRRFHTSTVYCDWEVHLTNGSWIDLNIDAIKTSSTNVKITSGGVNILQHNSGKLRSKTYYIMSNRLDIRMTIDPNESRGEKVDISYSQFIPGSDAVEEQSTDNLPDSPTCGGVITSDQMQSGNISSPGYPSYYLPNTFCSWTFNVKDTGTQRLLLRLLDMDIETNELGECVDDSVTITPSSEDGKICGIKENVDINVQSNSVTVTFRSDDQMQGSGFLLDYEFAER